MSTDATGQVRVSSLYLKSLSECAGDIAELRLALELLVISNHIGSSLVAWDALLTSEIMSRVVGRQSPRPAEERMQSALDRAVANGVVERVTVRDGDTAVTWVGPSTTSVREFVDRIRSGDIHAEIALDMSPEASVAVARPNVFALYERLIGPLTPLVAEELRDAERAYPRGWIEDAMLSAVEYNKRNWRYVQAILRGWEESGAPHAISQRHS